MTTPVSIARLEELLISEPASIMLIDAFSISHSSFTETQHIIRNYVPTGRMEATLEDDSVVTFQYVPIRLQRALQSGTLNQEFSITFQDLNEIIQTQEMRIPNGNTERPIIQIRTFEYNRATQTVTSQVEGPFVLRIDNIDYDGLGATVSAAPINTSQASTGVLMTTLAVTSLLGFTR